MSLVLHTLRSDESLNLGSFGVGFGAFLLGDDFATNDELAVELLVLFTLLHRFTYRTSSCLLRPKKRRIFVARLGPRRLG